MASALWLVVLSGVSVARASTLLRPRSHFPTTTLKHFGPQRFSMNVTGCPLVLLSARDLTRIHQNQRVSTSVHVAGAVVLFDWDDMPTNSFEWLYVDLEHAGAEALLLIQSWHTSPGYTYFWHDGSRGATTRSGAMPMLEAAADDAQQLMEHIADGQPALMILAPDANAWRRMWRGWAWILVMRTLLPAVGLATGARALANLRAHVQVGGRAVLWPPTKPVVVMMTEVLACPVLSVWFSCGVDGSSDLASGPATAFFSSGLSGLGFFTTFVMAVHWRAESMNFLKASATSAHRCVGHTGLAFALMCVVYDSLVSTLCAFHYCDSNAVSILAFTFALAQLGTAAYIFRSFWMLENAFRVHRRTNSQVAFDGNQAHLRRMSKWLAASGVCMLANVVGLCGYATSLSGASTSTIGSWVAVVYFSRMGTSYAQVMSLNMPRANRSTRAQPDYVAVEPQDERAREGFLRLQQLILGQETDDHNTASFELIGSAVVGFATTLNQHASDIAHVDLDTGSLSVLSSPNSRIKDVAIVVRALLDRVRGDAPEESSSESHSIGRALTNEHATDGSQSITVSSSSESVEQIAIFFRNRPIGWSIDVTEAQSREDGTSFQIEASLHKVTSSVLVCILTDKTEEREMASDEAPRTVQIEEITQAFETTLAALHERVQLAEVHQRSAEDETKVAKARLQDAQHDLRNAADEAKGATAVLQAAQRDTRAAEDDAKAAQAGLQAAQQEAKAMRARAEYSSVMQQMAESKLEMAHMREQIAQLEGSSARRNAEEAVLVARLGQERANKEAQAAREQLHALESGRIESTAGIWGVIMDDFQPLSFSSTRALLERERNEAVVRWRMGPAARAEMNRLARRDAYGDDEPGAALAAAAARLGLAPAPATYDERFRSHNAWQQARATALARVYRGGAARRIQRLVKSHAQHRLYRKYHMAVCFASRCRLPRPLISCTVEFAVGRGSSTRSIP